MIESKSAGDFGTTHGFSLCPEEKAENNSPAAARALTDASSMFPTMSLRNDAPSRTTGAGAAAAEPAFALGLKSAGGASRYVPVGADASPRCARTSPLVSIPRTPVPAILAMSPSERPCSCTRRRTEGKSGRSVFGMCEWDWGAGDVFVGAGEGGAGEEDDA